jgi:UDP-2,3-diacylglucosamine pyrophosphatase LpxH
MTVPARSIFVISDLHIGDGSVKDSFRYGKKHTLLQSFLDYVDKEDGELIIIGDLLELWGHRLEAVIRKQGQLLDRLAEMGAVFVPGNHDSEIMSWENIKRPPHLFFESARRPFIRTIGGKRFKFMHGHEADPFVQGNMQCVAHVLTAYTQVFAFEKAVLALSNDLVEEVILEVGENILRLWNWIIGNVTKTFMDCCSFAQGNKLIFSKEKIRAQNMLTRYYQDMNRYLYDVVIAGHTHKPGQFRNWYFNSGSWTGRTNNFLRISPDGKVDVSDWDENGPKIRATPLTA